MEKIEYKLAEHDNQILVIFEYLKQLEQIKQEELEQEPRKVVKGYRKNNKKR